jgi:hypothetical protein
MCDQLLPGMMAVSPFKMLVDLWNPELRYQAAQKQHLNHVDVLYSE